MSGPLLIRADSSSGIGAGHVMRCLALAQTWRQAGGAGLFVMAGSPGSIQDRLCSAGMEVRLWPGRAGGSEDAAHLAAAARELQAPWVILDGYHFDAGYQRQIKQAGLRLLCLDDLGQAGPLFADVILNPNLGASAALYPQAGEQSPRLLLGSRYALLRQEFLEGRSRNRSTRTGRRILVTLGGSDPGNMTAEVVRALAQLPQTSAWSATVVAGAGNPHLESLRRETAASPLQLRIDPPDLPDLMAQADLAIAAGGGTAWELAFMGLPALLIPVADNQVPNVQALEAAGVARAMPIPCSRETLARAISSLLSDVPARVEMSGRGQALIDGFGAFRAWLVLNESELRLRAAAPADSALVWEWANDPSVREASFLSEPISWADHNRWFVAKLEASTSRFFIACDNAGEPVGQARFDMDGPAAVISVSLSAPHRKRNFGPLLVWLACRKLLAETTVETIHARIKSENRASIRAFQKAGFAEAGRLEMHGCPAQLFELNRPMILP